MYTNDDELGVIVVLSNDLSQPFSILFHFQTSHIFIVPLLDFDSNPLLIFSADTQ